MKRMLITLRLRYHLWRAGRTSNIKRAGNHITAAIVLADRLGVSA